MSVLVNINFGAQADDTTLDGLLSGVSYSPSYPELFKVKGGQLTAYATYGNPDDATTAIIDTGLAQRRERFVLDQGGSKLIAARDDHTPMFLVMSGGNLTFVAFDRAHPFDEITRGFMSAPSTGRCSVEIRYLGDGTATVYVNNVLVKDIVQDSAHVPKITFPAGFTNGLTGFIALSYGGTTHGCASWIVRDETDVVSIDRTLQRRADATTSKLQLSGYIDVAGATGVTVTIRDGAGAVIAAAASGTVNGTSFEVTTNAYPASYTGQSIDLHVAAIGGSGYDDLYVIAPETFAADPARIGMNQTFLNYYTNSGEWRDLRNMGLWFVGGKRVRQAYEPIDVDVYGGAVPASDVGFTRYRVPRHFSTSTPSALLSLAFSWYWMPSQEGDYCLDLSEQPGLVPFLRFYSILMTPFITLEIDYYALHKHRLTLKHQDHSTHVGEAGDLWHNWGIEFDPATSTLIDKDWNFSCKRVGDLTPERYMSDEHIDWWSRLGTGVVRYMTDIANEYYGNYVPPKAITAQYRTPIDGCWVGGGRPIEAMAQLAAATGQALYRNLHRAVSDDFVGAEMGVLMEHFPDLEVIFESPNEPWNFGFGQWGALETTGYKAGLGASTARFGGNNGVHTIPADHVRTTVFAAGDQTRTANGIWVAKTGTAAPAWDSTGSYVATDRVYAPDGLWICGGGATVGLAPKDDPSHWTMGIPEYDPTIWALLQSSGLAQQRALSELVHMVADRVKGACGAALYGTRYKVVVGTHQENFGYANEVLKWGNLGAKIHGVATATYFGPEAASAEDTRNRASLLTAPGIDRQNQIMDVMETSAAETVGKWILAQNQIRALNAAQGWNLKLLSYEGGHHLQVFGPSIPNIGTPTNYIPGPNIDKPFWEGLPVGASSEDAQAVHLRLGQDVQALLDSDRFKGIWRDTLIALGEVSGGDVIWFDSFANRYLDHNTGHGLFYFGMAQSPLDFSARCEGMREAAIALGAYTPPSRRRRCPTRTSRSWRNAA